MPQLPVPFEPSELATLAQTVMRRARFPMLATVEAGQPRVRPVSPVRTDGFVVYIANLRQYGKTAELAANPRVELCYLDEAHDQVRITGTVTILSDAGIKDEIWQGNPLLRRYLGTPENPDLIIYVVTPLRVRFMREWALEYHEVTGAA